ncbi:hypothetical protein M5K25_020294 [Dendrobium thyrsiflorum]|uniref:Uncharacterized protein n=1 Tax=Dendrobium thyrsiflorum TaxID=117978 RepID=A0ABD0U9G9_DENTH
MPIHENSSLVGIISPNKVSLIQPPDDSDKAPENPDPAEVVSKITNPKGSALQPASSSMSKKLTRGKQNISGFNHTDNILCCKHLVDSFKLDMTLFFDISHQIFPYENSCHNFDLTPSGRIWVKWNTNKLHFLTVPTAHQFISGSDTIGCLPTFQLNVIYASNNVVERKSLWAYLSRIAPASDTPLILMGYFNCCRFASKKLGGKPLTHNCLSDFNSMIFDNSLVDLHSVGCKFT